MSMADAFAVSDAIYAARVHQATWGHLRVRKPYKLHKAKIVFTCAGYGGAIEIIASRIKGVDDSPWLYDHMLEFAVRKAVEGKVSVFEGLYYVLKNGKGRFRGKVRTVKV